MRSRVVAVACVVAWSGVAAAQETMLIPGDREASAQVASIVASARSAELPVEPIVSKVRYGVNVSRSKPDAIVRAATSVKARLELARDALAPNPTDADISNGADALGANATVDVLREVRKAGRGRPVATALGLLTQLLTKDVPLPKATKIVTDLLKQGATATQLASLGGEINGDLNAGMSAVASIDLRTQGLIAAIAAERAALTEQSLGAASDPTKSSGKPPQTPRRP